MVNTVPLNQPESQTDLTSWSENTREEVLTLSERVLRWPKTIEIAGYTILATPMERMGLTPEQEIKFIQDGGLINPWPKTVWSFRNKDRMTYWTEYFQDMPQYLWGNPHCSRRWYLGEFSEFDLFIEVYLGYPDYRDITKKEAIKSWFYPNVYYRNLAACEWMAKMHGGRLATKEEFYKIWGATPWKIDSEKLAYLGQWFFGYRSSFDECIYNLGVSAHFSFGEIDPESDDFILSLKVYAKSNGIWTRSSRNYPSGDVTSAIIILNK